MYIVPFICWLRGCRDQIKAALALFDEDKRLEVQGKPHAEITQHHERDVMPDADKIAVETSERADVLAKGLVRAALELACIRNNLCYEDSPPIVVEQCSDLVEDTRNALRGIDTCSEAPAEELNAFRAAIRAQAALRGARLTAEDVANVCGTSSTLWAKKFNAILDAKEGAADIHVSSRSEGYPEGKFVRMSGFAEVLELRRIADELEGTQMSTANDDWLKKYDAPTGQVWVCLCCGKQSSNRAEGPNGWDESCFLNAELRARP